MRGGGGGEHGPSNVQPTLLLHSRRASCFTRKKVMTEDDANRGTTTAITNIVLNRLSLVSYPVRLHFNLVLPRFDFMGFFSIFRLFSVFSVSQQPSY